MLVGLEVSEAGEFFMVLFGFLATMVALVYIDRWIRRGEPESEG